MDEPSSPSEVKDLICDLLRRFYSLGWVSGTGGGMSIRWQNRTFIAPSGVQKEYVKPEHIFELNGDGEIVENPKIELKMSECTPLFYAAYNLRDAGAVIHSHAIEAVLATLLDEKSNELRITRLEMIKGIRKGKTNVAHRYDEELVVPIIENTCFERDLTEDLQKAIIDYPNTNAVLVRRHGVYVWGNDWKAAKTMAECYHYLFKAVVKTRQLNL